MEGSHLAHFSGFRHMCEAHTCFHRAAGDVIRRADRGEALAIDAAVGPTSAFGTASSEVIESLQLLSRASA